MLTMIRHYCNMNVNPHRVAVVLTGVDSSGTFRAEFGSYQVFPEGNTVLGQERVYSSEVPAIRIFDQYCSAAREAQVALEMADPLWMEPDF